MKHYQRFGLAVAVFRKQLRRDPCSKLLVLTSDVKEALSASRELESGTVRVIHAEHRAVNRYLNAADIAFMLRDKKPMNALTFPTKFSEYCLAGLPIIMNDAVPDAFLIASHLGNIWSSETPRGRSDSERARVAEQAKALLGREASANHYRWIYGELTRRLVSGL